MCGRLDFSHWLHKCVSHDDADVGTRVTVRLLAQRDEVGFGEAVGRSAQVQLEHEGACVLLGQRDVDPLLKAGRGKGEKQDFCF